MIGLLVDRELVDQVPAGAQAEVVFDQTPFYAETGGQVGDRGALYSAAGEKVADVETAFPGVPGLTVHRIVALRSHRASATCCAPKWPRRCATPRGATIPRRTCCTPRCGRCWARTSSRPAAWWSPAACASISPITPPWTAPKSKKSSAS